MFVFPLVDKYVQCICTLTMEARLRVPCMPQFICCCYLRLFTCCVCCRYISGIWRRIHNCTNSRDTITTYAAVISHQMAPCW